MKQARALISCLTATKNRPRQLRRSIRCFCDQSYPARELVIAVEGPSDEQEDVLGHVRSLGRDDIRVLALEGDDYNLGKVRNILHDAARGEILCQWDDDDLNHPERLAVQAQCMIEGGAAASYLTDQLHYFLRDREMYWVDWMRGYPELSTCLIPGTLMMRADARFRYPEAGPRSRAGEDTAFQEDLCRHVQVEAVSGVGYLYVYVCHDGNTFSYNHHKALPTFRACTVEFALERLPALRQALDYYPLPRPLVFKAGNDEALFELLPR